MIDYLEATDHGLEWYARALKEKPYVYGRHFFPHDIEARDFCSDGRTRLAMAESLGLRLAVVVPRGDVGDGIQAVRTLFPRFVFDQEKCDEGLEALKAYRREWSETRKTWGTILCTLVEPRGRRPTLASPARIRRTRLPSRCRRRPLSSDARPLSGEIAMPDYARIAYEAYAEDQQWKNYQGMPIPAWEIVRQDIKDAWEAAVDAAFNAQIPGRRTVSPVYTVHAADGAGWSHAEIPSWALWLSRLGIFVHLPVWALRRRCVAKYPAQTCRCGRYAIVWEGYYGRKDED